MLPALQKTPAPVAQTETPAPEKNQKRCQACAHYNPDDIMQVQQGVGAYPVRTGFPKCRRFKTACIAARRGPCGPQATAFTDVAAPQPPPAVKPEGVVIHQENPPPYSGPALPTVPINVHTEAKAKPKRTPKKSKPRGPKAAVIPEDAEEMEALTDAPIDEV